jgi:hypothetical protein
MLPPSIPVHSAARISIYSASYLTLICSRKKRNVAGVPRVII